MVALFECLVDVDRRLRKEEMPKLVNAIRQLQIKKRAIMSQVNCGLGQANRF